jgi:hypothetical protein
MIGTANTAITPANMPTERMTEITTNMERDMGDDLRKRYDAITANIKEQREKSECGATVPIIVKALSWSSKTLNEAVELAQEAIERLEKRTTIISAPPVCVSAVEWMQKPLDCQGIQLGSTGKIDIHECEVPIPTGPIDIREFTCRRV